MKRTVAKGQAAILKNLVAQAALTKAASLLIEEAGAEILARRRIAASIGVLRDNGECLLRENAAFFAAKLPTIFSSSYEPEELKVLTSRLADVLDAMEETAFRLSAYDWAWLGPGIPRSCVCLKTCVDGIHSGIEGLVHRNELPAECLDIPLVTKCCNTLLRESHWYRLSADAEALTIFTNKEICKSLRHALSFCKAAITQLLILESSSV